MLILNENRNESIDRELDNIKFKIQYIPERKYREIMQQCQTESSKGILFDEQKFIMLMCQAAIIDWDVCIQDEKGITKAEINEANLAAIIEEFPITIDRVCTIARNHENWHKKKLVN
jgi:hypothetical protein